MLFFLTILKHAFVSFQMLSSKGSPLTYLCTETSIIFKRYGKIADILTSIGRNVLFNFQITLSKLVMEGENLWIAVSVSLEIDKPKRAAILKPRRILAARKIEHVIAVA